MKKMIKKLLILIFMSPVPLVFTSCSADSNLKLISMNSDGRIFSFLANKDCYWGYRFETDPIVSHFSETKSCSFSILLFDSNFENDIFIYFSSTFWGFSDNANFKVAWQFNVR